MVSVIKNDFLRIWEFFAWMDRARWSEDDVQYDKKTRELFNEVWGRCGINIKGENLEPDDIILAHWLTYIFDYGMPAESVWKKAFPIMAYVSYRYKRGTSWKTIMKEHVRSVKSDGANQNFEFYIKGPKDEQKFKHRFGAAHELNKAVERTLRELEEKYNKDLVTFMLEKSKGSHDDTWVKDVASALYNLTYEPDGKLSWHKRTWSALRDYLKGPLHRTYVCKALAKYQEKYPSNVLERWRKPEPYLDQLELPGDIWNLRFFENIRESYIKPLTGKDYKNNAPKAIRQIYEEVLHDEAKKRKLYPEQFDVTYDFARICKNERYMCPLGPNEVDKLCIGNLKNAQEKYCPLLASICHYFIMCNPDDCPVLKKHTQGLCKICKPLV